MKYKVLIADDEPELLQNYTEIVGMREDLVITTAKDGLDAYQKSRNQKFDLVITDMRMPKIDGAQLILALREHRLNSQVPIIVVSGYPDEVQKVCAHVQKLTFFAKPIDIDILMKQVDKDLKSVQNQKSAVVDIRVNNSVIDAAISVLKNFGGCKNIKNLPSRLFTAQDQPPSINISGTINVNSAQFCGEIIISFSETVLAQIISHILGETRSQITTASQDAAGEIANIIFGQAKQKLSDLQFEVSDARFRVLQMPFLDCIKNLDFPLLYTEFESSAGPFFITTCLQASASKGNDLSVGKTA